MDKRDRSEIFRNRLRQAMDHAGTNQSELARETGADRSTWSQVLQGTDARLPGAQQVAGEGEPGFLVLDGVGAGSVPFLERRPQRAD